MGRYRVVRKLAVGGMAEVLLAKVIGAGGFEKPVAVKRMLPSMAADPSFVEAFLREARLTVVLQHPNIVQVHDFGAVKGQYYQVLEYVDGENLRQVLTALNGQQQRLSIAEACYVVQQVAEGLAYAHGVTGQDRQPLNIIHRDINPSNVMVSRIGEVKLADFGIAKAADGSQGTQVGVIKGKAGYLSPEQVRGTEVDQRSDLFLMGLLLHELLSGKRLFDAPNYFQALQRIARFDPRELERIAEVPQPLWDILVKLLEPEPARRTASARVLSEELQAFLFDARMRVGTKEMAALFVRAFPNRNSPLEAMNKPAAQEEKSEEIQIDEAQVVEARPATGPTTVASALPPAPAAPPPLPTASAAAKPSAAPTPPPQRGVTLGKIGVAQVPASEARPAPAPKPTPMPSAPTPAPSPRGRRKIGEILLAQGKITQAQLDDALKRKEGRLGERLAAAGVVTELDVVRALAEQNGIPYVSDEKLKAAPVPEEAIKLLKEEAAAKFGAVPVQLRGRTLLCAMIDPLNLDGVKALKFAAGVVEVKPVYATEGAIRAARDRFYRGVTEAVEQEDDWRGRVPTYESAGITPFSDRATGTREKHFDEDELERRMSVETQPAPAGTPPPQVVSAASMPAAVGPLPAGITPSGGLSRPAGITREASGSLRLAASAAVGGVRKALMVTDRPEQLELSTRLLAGTGVQVVGATAATAEAVLAAEQPDLVVIVEDGTPQATSLARQLSARAPGVEVRMAALAACVLGEGPAMGRVSTLYAAALDALNAPGLPAAPDNAGGVPAAARLCRQLAGWLGGARVEQERAAALLHVVAAANRISNREVLALPESASLSTVAGGDGSEIAELLALATPRPPARVRPAALAVHAALVFASRAGGVVVERDEATFALERIVAESALPANAVEALRALVYQGGDSGKDSVVVVDADAIAAGVLQQRLVGAGLRAVLARTGSEARELMRRGARALVASTALPDTDGPVLVSAIRGEGNATPPIIYLLAQDASEDVAAGLDAGADDVMIKPVSAEVIAAKLRRALGGRSARSSAG